MKKINWIKMGFKIVKFTILVLLVCILQSNISSDVLIRTENFNLNKTLDMNAMVVKKEEEKTKPKPIDVSSSKPNVNVLNKYTGDLTGYSADCPLCNGTLACKPSYKVYRNGVVTYNDQKFGNVRIVASSKKLPCGSIIKFNLKTISNKPVYAIVLDRGVTGRDIDLLMPTEKAASKQVGRRKTTYEVLRNGW